MNTPPSPEHLRKLCKRLRAPRRTRYDLGEAGTIVVAYEAFANPDGPEAADAISSLLDRIAALEGALAVFARCPTQGKRGGRFVIANAVYEDMVNGGSAPRQAYWHLDDFERARALISTQTGEGE